MPIEVLPPSTCEEEEAVVVGASQQQPRKCAISHKPLRDPAKGEQCRHRAQCNFQELRAYAMRTKACPIAGCNARIPRSGDVRRERA